MQTQLKATLNSKFLRSPQHTSN